MPSYFKFLALLFLVLKTAAASDFQSPRTVALGGAGHAAPLLNDAIYLNPSYVSFVPSYGIAFNYLLYQSPSVTNGHELNASIQDGSQDLFFQAGLGFTSRTDANIFSLGASKAVIQKVGVGIGGKYVLPTNNSPQFGDTVASVTWLVTTWIQASLIADNIIESPVEQGLGFYREFVLGTKINPFSGMLLFYLDPHVTPDLPANTPWGYEAGVEFPVFTDFFLRYGIFQNAKVAYQNVFGAGMGAGLGWLGPKIAVEYGYSRVLDPSSFAHTFGATVFF